MDIEVKKHYIAYRNGKFYILKCTLIENRNEKFVFKDLLDNHELTLTPETTLLNPITAYMRDEEINTFGLDQNDYRMYKIFERAIEYEQQRLKRDEEELKKILKP